MRCAACFMQLIHRACLGFADEIDADEQDYRFVFLNTSDKPYFLNEEDQYPFGWRLEKSNQQAEWLEEKALKTDRKIIIFTHS